MRSHDPRIAGFFSSGSGLGACALWEKHGEQPAQKSRTRRGGELLQSVEAGLEDVVGQQVADRLFIRRRDIELRGPLGQRAVSVGDVIEPQGRGLIFNGQRGLENLGGEGAFGVRVRGELLAQGGVVPQSVHAHRAHLVSGGAVRQYAFLHRRVPIRNLARSSGPSPKPAQPARRSPR
jgi:hypothetical protein